MIMVIIKKPIKINSIFSCTIFSWRLFSTLKRNITVLSVLISNIFPIFSKGKKMNSKNLVHSAAIKTQLHFFTSKIFLSCEWIKHSWYIYTMEYYSAVKKFKKEHFTLWTVWVDLENIMLSEISQSEKDKNHVIALVCGI